MNEVVIGPDFCFFIGPPRPTKGKALDFLGLSAFPEIPEPTPEQWLEELRDLTERLNFEWFYRSAYCDIGGEG